MSTDATPTANDATGLWYVDEYAARFHDGSRRRWSFILHIPCSWAGGYWTLFHLQEHGDASWYATPGQQQPPSESTQPINNNNDRRYRY
jgi:hypothetical protein